MGLGVVGSLRDRVVISADRLIDLPVIPQGVTEIVVGLGVVWFESNRMVICVDGSINLPLFFQYIAEIAVRFRRVGIEGDGSTDQIRCNVIPSNLMGDHPQMVRCGRMVGLLGQDLSVELLGLGQPPGMVVLQRQIEGLLDRE